MKRQLVLGAVILLFLFGSKLILAQKDVTVTANDSDTVAGLDLQAVGDLFKDSKNLDEFEKNLNDPDNGINNLDLDNDGNVDYIRAVEKTADNTHLVILQAPLAKDEYQDVATIEVQKDKDDYNVQIQGNKDVYGKDVYVVPAVVHVSAWPIIGLMYGPAYHPYRSSFLFWILSTLVASFSPACPTYLLCTGSSSQKSFCSYQDNSRKNCCTFTLQTSLIYSCCKKENCSKARKNQNC